GVESFGNLVGLSGSQLTYYKAYKTLSPDKAGKCAESAKYGTQVQCLPVELTEKPGLVRMSCHFYMSAPKQAADKSATTAAVFDLTNDIVAALGRTMVLVDEPDKHLELAVEKLQP
ncbi:MAG TPA: hypothetical protein PLL10_10915, partial [Elusimicrobiales bacterium]|nr:hypothetical protein [Elusimicrobiales bacterium]